MAQVKKTIHPEEIAQKLASIFEEEGLVLALLFGSSISSKTHSRSDIDLAFLFDSPIDILELTNKVVRLLNNDNVDVVDLRRANPLLKFSAVKNCRILHEKSPGKFNEFYSLAFRMYVDTKKLRDAQEVYIKNSLKKRGLA